MQLLLNLPSLNTYKNMYLMKKSFLPLLFCFMISGVAISQKSVVPETDSKEYQQLKKEGKLPPGMLVNTKSFAPTLKDLQNLGETHKMGGPGGSCSCYQAPDATYTLAMAPNDDGSTSLLTIPFNFCLYGTNYTTLYINNNGNISFGSAYSTFSSNPFPDPAYIMVAPFWGDVDTRGTGQVRYKITPTAMYVNWEAVGYYSSHTDMVNTFQLIITDGTDPVLPAGNNIAFCYGDMQWTTGDASMGVGGFGGVPSTVGINKGDGVNYIQIGRFDQPGAAYDGGYGANDGVSWLDNQSFYFNSCNSTNIAPIVSGLSNCDTLHVCATGDTLILNGLFLSPEIGQTTTISINLGGTPGASILTNTPGNSAVGQVMLIASPANAGNNTITFTATDDGTPVGVSTITVNVFVDTTGLAAFNPVISGDLTFCNGDSSTLSVSPTTYDSYIWNTGSTGTSTVVDSSGLYFVTSTFNGCSKTNSVFVTEYPVPSPAIIGNLFTCASGTTTLSIDSTALYSNYVWSNGSTNSSINVVSGTFTVTVTDLNGCTGTSAPVTVINANPTVSVSGVSQFCPGDSITLTANASIPSGASYLWSNGATTPSTTITAGGPYTVDITYSNGCSADDSVFVTQYNSPVASFNITPANSSSPGVPVQFTDMSTVTPGTIMSWIWNFGDSLGAYTFVQNPTHVYGEDGLYPVTLAVQSSDGCWDTVKVFYEIISDITVPNVFTPNNDGTNDFLAFKNLEYFPGTGLTVYNRWGNKIYTSADYRNDWNGGGHNDGVYYFILEGPKLKETRYGFVQIISSK
jgi:gliding motility-associated-like protein